jgi:SNF2 family DNA or RNA helicase
MEFLGSTDRKLTIFHHHKDVGEMLVEKLSIILDELKLEPPLHLTADLDAQARYNLVTKFTDNPKSRILIASTLASGEGLNLQVCSDCIMLERQWNPANEEQAEARFPRPGSTASSISATYLVSVGTVDEFFSEIVERKREIVTATLGGEAVEWDQSSIMKELTEILAATGGQRWKI